MAEYTDRIDVAAPADAVFGFVSDVANLPKYLPTMHDAHAQGPDRVAVDGEANGHHYHSDGWFKVDYAGRSMSWGSDGENDYSGKDEGDRGRVEVAGRMRAAVLAEAGHREVDG